MNDKDYIGKDKLYHFLVCLILAFIYPLLAIVAAFGKEFYDATKANNHFCIWDLTADFIGFCIGTALHIWVF